MLLKPFSWTARIRDGHNFGKLQFVKVHGLWDLANYEPSHLVRFMTLNFVRFVIMQKCFLSPFLGTNPMNLVVGHDYFIRDGHELSFYEPQTGPVCHKFDVVSWFFLIPCCDMSGWP